MKVSEAMNQIKIGDDVWVKAKVAAVDQDYDFNPIAIKFFSDEIWLHEKDEISLTKPKSELIEVPKFVADWFEQHKDILDYSIWEACVNSRADYDDLEETTSNEFYDWLINAGGEDGEHERITLLVHMKDGYTVKEPKWAVKDSRSTAMYFNSVAGVSKDGEFGCGWSEITGCVKFTDKAKAEAVATLVEGSVEEV